MIGAFLKFLGVSAIGLVFDIVLALVLHNGVGLPLWLSATISFFVIAAFNYVIFEFWLFADGGGRFSPGRLLGVLAASSLAALARIGAVLTMEHSGILDAAGALADPAILTLAAGLSVVVNFTLNRFGVFARRKGMEGR